jgi:hypothetical protein
VRDIRLNDDKIVFVVNSANPIAMSNGATATCTSAVSFEFEGGYLQTADFAAIQKEIATVLATDEQLASSNTKTIELGQTIGQVEAILGKPEKVVKLGEKTTYFYKDMKVIFTNGKVSDVQ